jgi:hypothetical protein
MENDAVEMFLARALFVRHRDVDLISHRWLVFPLCLQSCCCCLPKHEFTATLSLS